MRQRVVCVLVAVAGVSAVLLGAYGAHGLPGSISPRLLSVWHTAVRFQFWHALALALTAVVSRNSRARDVAAWAFSLGILLFCGSLYALALGAPHALGLITPVGGVAFVVGWLALAWALMCVRQS